MTTKPEPKKPEDDWRDHTTPGFEINGRGQLRTKNYESPPPKTPTKQEEGE